MIEWGKVAEVAGGGFGVTILVLVILCLVVWIVGLVLQRVAKSKGKSDTEKR